MAGQVRFPGKLIAAALLPVLAVTAALAQDRPAGYPLRPIRIIVSSVPGGGLDMISRTVAQMLTDRWGQTEIGRAHV